MWRRCQELLFVDGFYSLYLNLTNTSFVPSEVSWTSRSPICQWTQCFLIFWVYSGCVTVLLIKWRRLQRLNGLTGQTGPHFCIKCSNTVNVEAITHHCFPNNDFSLTSWCCKCPENDPTLGVIWWKQRAPLQSWLKTIQNISGLLNAQDNEFHWSVRLCVWETHGLAK